jgi:hypothetical protein
MPAKFTSASSSNPSHIRLSQEFLYAVRTGKPAEKYLSAFKQADEANLMEQLTDDRARLAFWLNLYNAYVQIHLKKNLDLYKQRERFYTARIIEFAGRHISLDTIEHGILRRSAFKWSLGYLRNPFPPAFERKYSVSRPDYRIHFALNCGAASCPPIAFYKPEDIGAQLDIAAAAYLSGECVYDEQQNRVTIPKILLWFRGDFGGKSGILQLLRTYEIIPAGRTPAIRYKNYDWTLQLDKYY